MQVSDAAVEAAARAMHEVLGSGEADDLMLRPADNSWDEPTMPRWEQWREAAEAALAALSSAQGAQWQSPEGWRLVPTMRDGNAGLTPVMFDAFWRAFTEAREHRGNFESVNAGYNAMLRYAPLYAAPASPEGQ